MEELVIPGLLLLAVVLVALVNWAFAGGPR